MLAVDVVLDEESDFVEDESEVDESEPLDDVSADVLDDVESLEPDDPLPEDFLALSPLRLSLR